MFLRSFLFVLLCSIFIDAAVGQSAADDSNDVSIECPLCADPTHVPQDPNALFVSGDNTYSCQTAFDLGTLQLPAENCTFWQSRGETICRCAASAPEPNTCTLCDDGSSLPTPLLTATTDSSCAEIQVDSRRDEADLCSVYQKTFGIYCECENVASQQVEACRICGDSFLPTPTATLSFEDPENSNQTITTTCVELEFSANLPDAICSDFQALGTADCCAQPTLAPTDPPSSAFLFTTSRLLILVSLAMLV